MAKGTGLRERKKLQQRERLADLAAALFAQHGYDAVSMSDVARAADVSDQTVYNYFPAKQDLVLDRAEEILERYHRVVRDRPDGSSPADALGPLLQEDVDRFRAGDGDLDRGEFPALVVGSPALRRFALEYRERQTDALTGAILATAALPAVVARAHAAALVSVVQTVTDRIGAAVLDGREREVAAQGMESDVRIALADLDRHFRSTVLAP